MKTFEQVKYELVETTKDMSLKEAIKYLLNKKKEILNTRVEFSYKIINHIFIGSGMITFEYKGDSLNLIIKSNNQSINGEYRDVYLYDSFYGFEINGRKLKYDRGHFYEIKKEDKTINSKLYNDDFMQIINEIVKEKDIDKSITCEMLKLYVEKKIDFNDLISDNYC